VRRAVLIGRERGGGRRLMGVGRRTERAHGPSAGGGTGGGRDLPTGGWGTDADLAVGGYVSRARTASVAGRGRTVVG
jgi:hypothetical protein